MKRNLLSSFTAVIAASLLTLGVASAQSIGPKPFAVGIYGGASMPLGDFKDVTDLGFHVGVFGSTPLSGSLSIRLDGAYNDFGSKSFTFADTTITRATKIYHTTIDVQYDLGRESEIAIGGGSIPYISGGAGFYHFALDDSCTGTGCDNFVLGELSETRWGINVGAGANFFLSGFTPFVDLRYHTTSPKTGEVRFNMFLASVGLKF